MIEYIFFDAALQSKFVDYAASAGITCTLLEDQLGLVVAVPEDIGDELEDLLEEHYALLEKEQSNLFAQEDGGFKQIAGLFYTTPDGESRMVPLQADVASRLLSVFSIEEIQSLFEVVANSALNSPDEKPLCKILAESIRPTSG